MSWEKDRWNKLVGDVRKECEPKGQKCPRGSLDDFWHQPSQLSATMTEEYRHWVERVMAEPAVRVSAVPPLPENPWLRNTRWSLTQDQINRLAAGFVAQLTGATQ